MNNMLHMKHTLLISTLLSTLTFGTSAQELDLKPISNLNHSYKLAKICFLPDCQDGVEDINMNINKESKWCEKQGIYQYYISAECPNQTAAEETCERDIHYIKCTKEQWCKNNKYETKAADCRAPEYPDQQCQGLDLYKQCKRDPLKACKEINPNFTNQCPTGWQVDQNNVCPYDPTIGICCNKCSGFDYTASTIPTGYEVGESCTSCSGIKYKAVEKACSGYQVCGQDCTGQESACQSGSTMKYSSCQCDPCPGYYPCGDQWQYCTGTTCKNDSSRCSVPCVSDYFPFSCPSSSACSAVGGISRGSYCSKECRSSSNDEACPGCCCIPPSGSFHSCNTAQRWYDMCKREHGWADCDVFIRACNGKYSYECHNNNDTINASVTILCR